MSAVPARRGKNFVTDNNRIAYGDSLLPNAASPVIHPLQTMLRFLLSKDAEQRGTP